MEPYTVNHLAGQVLDKGCVERNTSSLAGSYPRTPRFDFDQAVGLDRDSAFSNETANGSGPPASA